MVAYIFPAYLWLLLLIPLLWGLTLGLPRRLAWWRFWGSLLLRTVIIAALVLALAGTQLLQPVGRMTVVFLLDSSDSVALSQRAAAETYIQAALARMPADDQAGLVVFGEQALIERVPDEVRTLGQMSRVPPGTRTDIQGALQLGLALLPAETQRRLVLLSDGGENSGDARTAARLASSRGIPIDVVPLGGSADGLDGQISGLELPAAASEGQQVRLVVRLDSQTSDPAQGFPASARLVVEQSSVAGEALSAPRQLIEQPVELSGEPQAFTFTLPPPEEGFSRYVVRLLLPDDARPENNAAEAFTLVRGPPRLLLVEGTTDAARPLHDALLAAGLQVERRPPVQLPTTLGGLLPYDAVVLVDVPRRALSERTQANLRTYVRDLGRGLAMIGGEQSFGVGGWRDTVLEEALPVDMELRPEVKQPPVSIVVIIDVSGSMAAEEGGFSKVQLAAAGAARIAEQLRDEDEITVIPFDTEAQGVVGPISGSQRQQAINRLRGVEAGGGGINYTDAMELAASVIRNSDRPVRHVITITDGSDTVQQEGGADLVDTLRAEGVTVSSVAVGSGEHVPFLEDMVRRGAGRFFLTERASDIPSILADEAQEVIEPLIIEGEIAPRYTAAHPILRDVPILEAPLLYGYVATTPKDSARVLLAADNDDPLLAVWQYGLGRGLAWTPDMRGQWAREWLTWFAYPELATRMMVWLLPAEDTNRLTLETQTLDNQLVLTARARTETGAPATGLRVAGQLLGPQGSTREIVLREVEPGEYRFGTQGMTPGVYLVQVLASTPQGDPQGSVTGGAAVPFPGEYLSQGANPALLDTLANQTGGRTEPPPAAVYDDTPQRPVLVREVGLPLVWLALLLLPLDIAIRRLFGRSRWLGQVVRPGQTPRPEEARQPASAKGKQKRETKEQVPQDDRLARLRERQEQARRRARGDE